MLNCHDLAFASLFDKVYDTLCPHSFHFDHTDLPSVLWTGYVIPSSEPLTNTSLLPGTTFLLNISGHPPLPTAKILNNRDHSSCLCPLKSSLLKNKVPRTKFLITSRLAWWQPSNLKVPDTSPTNFPLKFNT